VRLALAAVAAALVLGVQPAAAAPGRISVGLSPGADPAAVAATLDGSVVQELGALDALVVSVPDVQAALAEAGSLDGVEYAELDAAARTLMFAPNDPLYPFQWYLPAIHAFDAWSAPPLQPPVRVAIVDSGIDGTHPELSGRIVASRSFVGGSALTDSIGHGTIVAGEIGAALDNGEGIAGLGIPVELVIAKVTELGSISLANEANAIRWAVDQGAEVVNLSLGGPRDPKNPKRDSYSALEHAAVEYAVAHDVVVVAAAGNCSASTCPEQYASYPAALPHVLGVGALNHTSDTPLFSNRDKQFVDVAAPGVDMASTFPIPKSEPSCEEVGYTLCARTLSYRTPRGTSFSAPLATATAAVAIGERARLGLPALSSNQVTSLVEASADDIGTAGRDARSGNGRLNVVRTVAGVPKPVVPADVLEPNDESGEAAAFGAVGTGLNAVLDRWDDPRDVYRVKLRYHQRIAVQLRGPVGAQADLYLWRPKTIAIGSAGVGSPHLAAFSRHLGANERIVFRTGRAGWFYVEVRQTGGRSGAYRLSVVPAPKR
jgi:subtilisin family serine protease